jgi:hypothetical protein
MTAAVTVTADLPWLFLLMVWNCAEAECKALLAQAGSSGGEASHLTGLLHKALEHAADLLHQTAVSEHYVRSTVNRAQSTEHSQQSRRCCQHATLSEQHTELAVDLLD